MPRGCGSRRSRNSSRRRSGRSCSVSFKSTTGTCRRPPARCRCRAVTCTRRSSATDWRVVAKEQSHEGEGPQRARLGSRDARGGQAPREVAGRRPHARPRRADCAGLASGLRRRRPSLGRIPAHRPGPGTRLAHHMAPRGARRRPGHRHAGMAVHSRLRIEAGVLSYWRDDGDGRRRLERADLVEKATGHRAHAVDHPDDLGSRPGRASTAAAPVRENTCSILLPRTVKAMAPEFKNFIAGDWVSPGAGEYFENRNPADWNDVIGRFPRSGPDDLKRAIASAKRGFAQWSKTPAPIRGQVLQRVGQLLVERKDAIARAMTREMGKVVAETGGDVQEGIDTAFYAATEGRRLFGRVVPSELRSKWAMSYRRPIGIAGLITPFNFPLAIPTWKMFPALLCGNAVIFKPAEDVPPTAHLPVEGLPEAGLPA